MRQIDYVDICMNPENSRAVVLLNGEIVGQCHVAHAGENGCVVVYVYPDGLRLIGNGENRMVDPNIRKPFVHIFWGKVEIFMASEDEENPMHGFLSQGKKVFDAIGSLKVERETLMTSNAFSTN